MSVHLDSILSTLSHAPLAKLSFKSINKTRLEKAAAAVVEHKNIVNVDLSHNSITSRDAVHIARIISAAAHVERLNISCNDFSDAEGCRLIAAALQENTSLKHLDIRASRVTDAGAAHLLGALQHNSTLLTLNMGNCSVSDASVDSICRVIESNRSLQSLHLKGCDLSQPALLRVLNAARDSGRFDGMGANALDAPDAQSNMLQEVGCCLC